MDFDGKAIPSALLEYTGDVAARAMRTDFDLLAQIARTLIEAKERGATIYTAGNGGSAATASHICNDLLKGCRVHNREGFKTECLADSCAVMTCLGNDFSYEEIFSIQLRTKAHRGDVLLVYSGSGNSPNIVRLVDTAREMGVVTIGFSGRDGGKLAGRCDLLLIAPTDSMEQIEDLHMLYVHALSSVIQQVLPDRWGVEYVRYPDPKAGITTALFDFDGTVSLIREGWREIMVPYFAEVLGATGTGESPETLCEVAADFVDALTGKQTIFQCIRLDEEVQKRGGPHRDPLEYKAEYLRRLGVHIRDRREGLENGTIDPSGLLVPGVRELVGALREAGIACHLASGTDEADVLHEARLLGLDGCFDAIHGARDEMTECSKEQVLRGLFADGTLRPEQLVSFGDGYVEIELVAQLGGYTFGVATDEVRRKGINEWKRRRLLSAGADAIIPDFAGYRQIVHAIREGI